MRIFTFRSVPKLTATGGFIATCSLGCAPLDVDYAGFSSASDQVGFAFDQDGVDLLIEDPTGQMEFSLAEESNPDLDAVEVATGTGSGHLIRLEDTALVTHLGLGEAQAPMTVALSDIPAKARGAYVSEALITKDYLWVRVGHCDTTTLAWGFATFGDGEFHLREMDASTQPEDIAVGEGTIDSETADRSGTWAMDPDALGHLNLEMAGKSYEAWTVPGESLIMTQPDGLLVAVANPTAHLSVLKAAGVYKFLDVRCDADGGMDQGVGNFQVFDREVSLIRYDSQGDTTTQEGMLGFYEPVGSAFGIIARGEEGAEEATNVSYFALAGDMGVIFHFGETQRVGIAMKVGIAGL